MDYASITTVNKKIQAFEDPKANRTKFYTSYYNRSLKDKNGNIFTYRVYNRKPNQ